MESCEWSEFGDEEFESTTDDEVFDKNTGNKNNSPISIELQDNIEKIGFSEKLLLSKKTCIKGDDSIEQAGNSEEHGGADNCDSNIRRNTGREIQTCVSSDVLDDGVLSQHTPSIDTQHTPSIDTLLAESNNITTNTREVIEDKSGNNDRLDYTGCDMQSVERPSLSGEEDV